MLPPRQGTDQEEQTIMIIASDLEGTLTTSYIGLSMGQYVRDHGRGLAYRLFFASQVPPYLLYTSV